jgi:molybdate transport system substrate-binding protein
VALAACGSAGGSGTGTNGDGGGDLTVAAAASLTEAFTQYAGEVLHPQRVRLSFAGSDELAAQIRQGVKPDVFASANTSLPDALYREGLVGRPMVFTSNQLVVAVPAEGGRVQTLADLSEPGTTIAIGSATVPIGAYTREVLGRLPHAQEQAILANVRSEEPDVKGIVGKLTQGAVDAGFVYWTDVRAADRRLSAIALPARLEPKVAYAIALVSGAAHPAAARRFAAGLRHGRGLQILHAAGFDDPPPPPRR